MKWLAISLMIASFAMIGPARAQLRGSTDAAAPFSAAERTVIARNEMLRSIADEEPALVRRVLDALAAIDNVQTRGAPMPSDPQIAPSRPGDAAGPSNNPDLDRLERSSPEAMNDLFQLLKQASGGRRRPTR
jgi:hypothetical protein